MSIEIRPAQPSDAPQILAFITELADYEKARHEVIASVADIERSLFSEGATAHGLICLRDGVPIGFAVFFFSYSTWLGSNCLYLEDLYITPTSAAAGRARRCCGIWRRSPVTTIAAVSNGVSWTGTRRPSSSTSPWVRSLRKNGCATAWTARCYGISPRAIERLTSGRWTPTGQIPVAAPGACNTRQRPGSAGAPWAPGASGARIGR
ncbi:hypothetical protein PHLH5_38370 [Pseudomonas sp. Cab53]|nr:hypothetical protein PHLH5_38370 [Pseudomonas sp. Cab53]